MIRRESGVPALHYGETQGDLEDVFDSLWKSGVEEIDQEDRLGEGLRVDRVLKEDSEEDFVVIQGIFMTGYEAVKKRGLFLFEQASHLLIIQGV